MVSEVIRDNEFGATPGDWRRTVERAMENGGFAAQTVDRIVNTARGVLAVLRDRALAMGENDEEGPVQSVER